MMGNAAHQKMESIGEISNETSSSTRSGSQPNYKSSKTVDNHNNNNNNNKEKEPVSPHKKSSSSNEPSPECVVSLVLMSGERVDVSNLVPESERTPERLNRRRVKQLIKPNETVYPKLPDPILHDDNGIDLQMLLEQHQRKQQNSPTPPSRRMVELEQSPQQWSPNTHSNGYPTLPVVGSNSNNNNNNDRRTRWQHDPTFAQHSFERRQQERSQQQERPHQFATHKDNDGGRNQHYPYARADSRHQQQFAGENNNGGVSDEIALDRRSHQRWEAAYGEQQSSRTRIMNRPSLEQPVEYEYPYQHHHAHLQQQQHPQQHHHAQYREEHDDRSQPQQHYPYGNGWAYPSSLSNSGDPQFGRRREQRAREQRQPQQPPQQHEYQHSADGHDGYGGGVYERNSHASMYEFRMSRDFDRGQHDYPQPSQRQLQQPQQQSQGPTPHNNKKNLEVEIAPGVMARLRGADETTVALQQGRVVASDCLCCGSRSLCIDDASYLLCPVCKVVNPLCNNARGDTSGGVGLGILEGGY
jgi:hypothetical protein